MRRPVTPVGFADIFPHLLSGAGLGAVGACCLMTFDPRLASLLLSESAATFAAETFMAASMAMMTVGSGLTGFVLLSIERADLDH